jgi:hypothetical protein
LVGQERDPGRNTCATCEMYAASLACRRSRTIRLDRPVPIDGAISSARVTAFEGSGVNGFRA